MKALKGSPTFLLKVRNDGDEYDNCEFAVLTMTKELVDSILQTITMLNALKQFDREFYQIQKFGTYAVQYLSSYEAFDGQKALDPDFRDDIGILLDNNEYLQVDSFEVPENTALRIDVPLIICGDNGVQFDCNLKHTSIRLYTERISVEDLKEINFG